MNQQTMLKEAKDRFLRAVNTADDLYRQGDLSESEYAEIVKEELSIFSVDKLKILTISKIKKNLGKVSPLDAFLDKLDKEYG